MEAHEDEAPHETLDRLHREVEELRASRARMVLAADADRRSIERDLHESVQQHLVALAVELQLTRQRVEADPSETKVLLGELQRAVQETVEEAARLAERIHPPLPEVAGLAAALRTAALKGGVRASIDVSAGGSYPAEIVRTVYLCCLEALEHAGGHATLTIQDTDEIIVFEITDRTPGSRIPPEARLEQLRDRVEALGGRLVVESHPGRGIRISGSLPLSD